MVLESTLTDVANIAHTIQLAVAPVFLLSGVGVLLGVLTNRLARVVDRARPLEDRHRQASGAEAQDLKRQLQSVSQRARLMNTAIALSTCCALLVSVVVGMLFASAFVHFNLALPVAGLFILAMLCLVGALVAFLLEVRLATRTLRIGPTEPS